MAKEDESNPYAQSEDLTELYKSWGIFDSMQVALEQLPNNYLHILNIARNLLDGKPIPGVDIPENFMGLLERDQKTVYEKRYVTRTWQQKTNFPSDSIKIRPIQSLRELPQVLPPYRLLKTTNPDIFAYKAITGNLPIIEQQKPRVQTEEKSETLEEVVPKLVKGMSKRQAVYALMDVSMSMAENYKLIVAKSILLAYFKKASEEDAQVYFRAFSGDAHGRTDCLSPDQFGPLARNVLGYPLSGTGTYIGNAVSVAIRDLFDMREERVRNGLETEILLITDCDSSDYLPIIPRSISLHTLHLNGGDETYHRNSEQRKLLTLFRSKSKTFTQLNTSGLNIPVDLEKQMMLREELEKLEEIHKEMDLAEIDKDKGFQKRVKKLAEMSKAYEKMFVENKEHKELSQKAQALRRKVSGEGLKKRLMEKLKAALSLKSSIQKRLKGLKLPSNDKLSGTLFDFRIRK
ncbi:MAG: vWA domain-containing protein [Microgenomates group bacterium]|jgi:uncharacterized protein with von Willebrand factor type A (vWA) domain